MLLNKCHLMQNSCLITDSFLDEQLLVLNCETPWYADFVNYLVSNRLPCDLSFHQRKKFLHDVKYYVWDEPYLFKQCNDRILRRCVPKEEVEGILKHCHASDYGGHLGGSRTAAKVL